MSLAGRSKSTVANYTHYLAKAALYFNKVPTLANAEQVDNYLYHLQKSEHPLSESSFKFTIYSFRFAFRMDGLTEKHITLPSIKRDKKLPVVLSREEVRRLLGVPKLLKHRVLIGLLYGCGLRCFEARNVKLPDIDLDRKMLHVRQGKGKKDRYVPVSDILIVWLREYIASENLTVWLFNGRGKKRFENVDSHYSPRGVGWVIRKAAKRAGIIKRVSTHTLRHTFATHLLEDGLDIVSIKDLLGHANIATTLVYLHVAHYDRVKSFSPLDTIYGIRQNNIPLAQFTSHQSCSLAEHLISCEHCRRIV